MTDDAIKAALALAESLKPNGTYITSAMSNADYQQHQALSRSKLWKLYSKTPAHALVKQESTSAMDFGSGVDVAILEPDIFDIKVIRGPVDRRGNKWKEVVEANPNGILLIDSEYDDVRRARDSAMKHPLIRKFIDSVPQRQRSAFAVDPETGLWLKARPDAYSKPMKMMVDLKTSRFVNKFQWEKQAADLGYHLQEPFYSKVWQLAGGGDVEAFAFFVVENEAPFSAQVFEFGPDDIAEGEAIMKKSLLRWKECEDKKEWPGPSTDVQQVSLPRYAFRETTPSI